MSLVGIVPLSACENRAVHPRKVLESFTIGRVFAPGHSDCLVVSPDSAVSTEEPAELSSMSREARTFLAEMESDDETTDDVTDENPTTDEEYSPLPNNTGVLNESVAPFPEVEKIGLVGVVESDDDNENAETSKEDYPEPELNGSTPKTTDRSLPILMVSMDVVSMSTLQLGRRSSSKILEKIPPILMAPMNKVSIVTLLLWRKSLSKKDKKKMKPHWAHRKGGSWHHALPGSRSFSIM